MSARDDKNFSTAVSAFQREYPFAWKASAEEIIATLCDDPDQRAMLIEPRNKGERAPIIMFKAADMVGEEADRAYNEIVTLVHDNVEPHMAAFADSSEEERAKIRKLLSVSYVSARFRELFLRLMERAHDGDNEEMVSALCLPPAVFRYLGTAEGHPEANFYAVHYARTGTPEFRNTVVPSSMTYILTDD